MQDFTHPEDRRYLSTWFATSAVSAFETVLVTDNVEINSFKRNPRAVLAVSSLLVLIFCN